MVQTMLNALQAFAWGLRALLRHATRTVYAAWLRYVIWETETWVRACEADGLHHSLHLTRVRHELAVHRVRLILLETTP